MHLNPIKNYLNDSVKVPKDVTMDIPYMTIVGNSEISIENYIGIIEYRSDFIWIQTKYWNILLYGKNLEIIYYQTDDMKICGTLLKLEYKSGGKNCCPE